MPKRKTTLDKLRPISGKAAVDVVRQVFPSAYHTFLQSIGDIRLQDSPDRTFDSILKLLLDEASDHSLAAVAAPAYAYVLVLVSVGLTGQAGPEETAAVLASSRTFEVAKGAQSVLGALATMRPEARKEVFAAWRGRGRALLANNDNVRSSVASWLDDQALADPFKKAVLKLEDYHVHSQAGRSKKIPGFRRYE